VDDMLLLEQVFIEDIVKNILLLKKVVVVQLEQIQYLKRTECGKYGAT
jgi:hypothetical protein